MIKFQQLSLEKLIIIAIPKLVKADTKVLFLKKTINEKNVMIGSNPNIKSFISMLHSTMRSYFPKSTFLF